MENIGKRLRDARKELGKSLEDIHEETRVNVDHLRLLEQESFGFLPETYVKSFLRTYCEALGLPAEQLLAQYDENKEAEEPENDRDAAGNPAPVVLPQRRQVVEWLLGAGSFILIASLILLYLQYRTHILAGPADLMQRERGETTENLAKISVQKPDPNRPDSPLEMEILAFEKIWLRLVIDGKRSSEYTLSPRENRTWLAQDRFEVLLKGAGREDENMSTEIAPDRLSSGVVRFSVSRDSFREGGRP